MVNLLKTEGEEKILKAKEYGGMTLRMPASFSGETVMVGVSQKTTGQHLESAKRRENCPPIVLQPVKRSFES